MIIIKKSVAKEKIKYKKISEVVADTIYIERPKVPKVAMESRFYKLYRKAYNYSGEIIGGGDVSRYRTATERAAYVYEHPRFKDVVEIGNQIKRREINSIVAFFSVAVGLSVIAAFIAMFFSSIFPIFVIPAIFIICGIILFPKVSYKKFYVNIYMPIAYYAAGMYDRREGFSFIIKKERGIYSAPGKETVISKFIIDTHESQTEVKRLTLSDTINQYRFEKGRLMVSKKQATVFSGYSFETTIKSVKGTVGTNLKYAIINDNTYFKIPGLTKEERDELVEEVVDYPGLNNYGWKIYRDKYEEPLPKKQLSEIQKKILAASRELGVFNIYVYDNYIKIMYNISFNREGIDPKLFESSLLEDVPTTYSGFSAIVKALYIMGINEMFMKTLFGQQKLEQTRISDSKRFLKRQRRGEAYIDVVIKLAISFILAGIVYSGVLSLCKNYITVNARNLDEINQAYEQSEPISFSYDDFE